MEKLSRYYYTYVIQNEYATSTHFLFCIYDRLLVDDKGENKPIVEFNEQIYDTKLESRKEQLMEKVNDLNYKHLLTINKECSKNVEQPTFKFILMDELAGLTKVRGKWVKR